MEPAREVGGDLYDVLRLPGDRLFVVLGDVSGKGIPAAMFMMLATALLRVAARGGLEASELLARLNEELCVDNPTSMFVTLACAVADGAAGTLRYAMAGHPTPVLLTAAGEPRLLSADAGTIVGVLPGLTFPSATVQLEPGDTLVLYSDGVTESFDPQGRAFGEDRLLGALAGLDGGVGARRGRPSCRTRSTRSRRAPNRPTTSPSSLCAGWAPRRWCSRCGPIPTRWSRRPTACARGVGPRVSPPPPPRTSPSPSRKREPTWPSTRLARRPEVTFRVRLAQEGGEAVLEVRDPGAPFNPLEAPPPMTAPGYADSRWAASASP